MPDRVEERQRKPEAVDRKAAQPPAPARAVDAVLQLQQGHGNAFVARMLKASGPSLYRAPPTATAPAATVETPIRADAGTGIVVSDTAAFLEKPLQDAKILSELKKDQSVALRSEVRSEAGSFYGVEVDGKRGYVRSGDMFTAVDSLPSAKEAEFAAKAAAVTKAIDDAGHTIGGKPAAVGGTAKVHSGIGFPKWFMDLQYKVSMMDQWDSVEESAQQVLDDYATWYIQMWHGGKVPPSLKSMFEYIGRSSKNDAAARKGGMQGTQHFGGAKGQPNWCTATSTIGVLDGLREMGYEPSIDAQKWANNVAAQKTGAGKGNFIGAPDAYTAKLLPGDQIMYLFAGAQYGGHTVTVVDDLGDSFTHISGNTGAAVGVGIGESKRWRGPPMNGFSLTKCNSVDTEADRKASTEYIATVPWGDKVLTYSIVRYGQLFDELETLKALDPVKDAAAIKKMLDKYKLRPATPKTVTA